MFQKIYARGETIFNEGEHWAELYIIRHGKVRITKLVNNTEVELAVLSEGDFFGEMSLFLQSDRSASAIALENTETFSLDKEAFVKQIQKDPSLAIKIIKKLMSRVDNANQLLVNHYSAEQVYGMLNEDELFVDDQSIPDTDDV